MRVDFCTFTDGLDKPVAVNPQQVRCVRTHSDGTHIEFDDKHYVVVKASVAEVERGLTISEN